MSAPDSFAGLARQLLAGELSPDDAGFGRYVARLVALARARLDPRLKARVDPEDVVQSALRSFFVALREGSFAEAEPARLWALLVVLTLRKCHRQADLHFAALRDVRREEAPAGDGSAPGAAPAASREPTPEEAALLAETVEGVMAELRTPLKRRVLEMSLQGHSVAEIARELHYYERGVERARAEARALLLERISG
jgi:RNA polymerase sigma-70 factor (ECF subfamily)